MLCKIQILVCVALPNGINGFHKFAFPHCALNERQYTANV